MSGDVLSPGSTPWSSLVGPVLVPVVSVAYFTSSSGFLWDDLTNFRQAQLEGMSLHYLLEPTSAHFAPGHRLGDWVVQALFPMSFPVAQGILLVLFAASLLLFHRLVAELSGPGTAPKVLTLLYGASTVHVAVVQWWAAGLDRLPATVLSFASILAYLRFFRTGSRRSLAVSVGALSLALLFYVKPVFVPLYLVLLRVLVLEPHRAVRTTLSSAVQEWRVWVLYAVPIGLYSLVYLRGYREAAGDPSLRLLARYSQVLWFKVVTPGLFGVYIPKGSLSGIEVAAAGAAQLAVVAGLVWTLLRSPGAWRAWAFFAITFVVNAAVVGFTRIGYFGPETIAYRLDYNLEAGYLFFITVAVIWHRRRDSLDAASRARGQRGGDRAVVAAAVVAYVACAWWGAAQISDKDMWFGARARQYMDRVDGGLRQARSGGAIVTLVDGTVPRFVQAPFAVHYNSFSEVFPLLDDELSFEASTPDLFDVLHDGSLRPVRFAPVGGGAVERLPTAGASTVRGRPAPEGEEELCVRSGAATEIMRYTPEASLLGDDAYLSLRYTSRTGGLLALIADPGGDRPPGRPRFLMMHRGEHSSVYSLGASRVQRLHLVLAPRSEACVGPMLLGRLVPRA